MKKVGSMELLSREEEYVLGNKIQEMIKIEERGVSLDTANKEEREILRQGVAAVEELVQANVGLVHNRVQRYRSHYNNNVEYEDLFQDGMMGLLTAVYKYDPSRGNKFSTVAFPWIFQAINRSTNNYSRLVRLPENRIIEYGKIIEITNRYEEEEITAAELDEIIKDELNLTDRVLRDIRTTMSPPTSLNKPITTYDSGSRELIDFIEEDQKEEFEDNIVKAELMSILQESLNKLSVVEKAVISSSFALDGVSEHSLDANEVKEKYSLSRAKFNNTLNRALTKVKAELEDLGLSLADFT